MLTPIIAYPGLFWHMMFVIVMVDEFCIIIAAITHEGNKLFGLVKLHPQLIYVAFDIWTLIELLKITEEELQWNIASLPLILNQLLL